MLASTKKKNDWKHHILRLLSYTIRSEKKVSCQPSKIKPFYRAWCVVTGLNLRTYWNDTFSPTTTFLCTIRFLILSPILTLLSLYLITAKNQATFFPNGHFQLTNIDLICKRKSYVIIHGCDRKVADRRVCWHRYSQDDICIAQTCVSKGYRDNSIMQENFSRSLKQRVEQWCLLCIMTT